jgi:hypothetical protein
MVITEFTIASDFKTIILKANTETAAVFNLLEIYIGSNYLNSTPIDLTTSKMPVPLTTLDVVITLADLSLDPTAILDGIFTVHLADNTGTPVEIEQGIANLYYINLALANMIIVNNAINGFEDVTCIYFLTKSINIFLPANKIEQALNSYERIIAMLENNPKYLVTEDLTPCATGSGCWIINGTYVII